MSCNQEEPLRCPQAYGDSMAPGSQKTPGGARQRISKPLSGMHRFPPSFNLYGSWSLSANWNGLWYLGHSKEKTLYTLATGRPFSKKTPTLHEGPNANGPVIGTVKVRDDQDVADIYVVVYPQAGSLLQQPLHIIMGGAYNLKHPFETPVRPDGHLERFEWHATGGEEVQELNAGKRGWKLIWISQKALAAEGTNKGQSSDGFEVVAVAALNVKGMSTTKAMKFSFVGRGATGEFGETWETVVVLTFMQLYELDCMNTVNASHIGRDPGKKGNLAGFDIFD